jgi:hypothetical protein
MVSEMPRATEYASKITDCFDEMYAANYTTVLISDSVWLFGACRLGIASQKNEMNSF